MVNGVYKYQCFHRLLATASNRQIGLDPTYLLLHIEVTWLITRTDRNLSSALKNQCCQANSTRALVGRF
jgi:hypothetical protein